MKKIILWPLVLLFCFSCGVGYGDTTLDVFIFQQPLGGESVDKLLAEFTVYRDFKDKSGILQTPPPPEDITVTAEWWWQSGDGTIQEMVGSSDFFINSDESIIDFSYTADPGYVLLNFYWVKVSWIDDNGFHVVETEKAYCYQSQNYSIKAPDKKEMVSVKSNTSPVSVIQPKIPKLGH